MANVNVNFIELFANHTDLNTSDYSTILQSLSLFFDKISSSSSSSSLSQQNIVTICTNTNNTHTPMIQVPSKSTINRIEVEDMILRESRIYTKYTFFVYENIGHIVFRFVQQDTEQLFGILHMYYAFNASPPVLLLQISDITKELFEETFQNKRTNLHMTQSLSYKYYFKREEEEEEEEEETTLSLSKVQLQIVYYQLIFAVLLRLMDKKCTYDALGTLKNGMESSVVLAEIFNGINDVPTFVATFFSSVNKNMDYKQKWTVYHLVKSGNHVPDKLSFLHCDCFQSIHTFFHFQFQALNFHPPIDSTLRAIFYLQKTIFQANTNGGDSVVYETQLSHVLSCISQLSDPNEFTPSKLNILKENSLGTVVYECGIVRIQNRSSSLVSQLENTYHQVYFLFLLSTERLIGIFDFFSVNEFQSSKYIVETSVKTLYNVQFYD